MTTDVKKALVTGGTGFIGRALVKKLASDGYSVRVTTRRAPSAVSLPGAEVARVSFDDPGSLEEAVRGCSVVYHLAAALYGHSREDFVKANVEATSSLAKACARVRTAPARFVYVSSLAAGGPSPDPRRPRTEEDSDNPVSSYGITKLGGERELDKLHPSTERVILRPPIVYGKNDIGFSRLASWVKNGIMIKAGPGETFFSFIFLDDLVEALRIAADNKRIAGGTYYVCEDRTYPWTFFIEQIASAMGRKMPWMLNLSRGKMFFAGHFYEIIARIAGLEPVFNRDKAREACAGHWIASSRKWMTATGWPKWTPLAQGMKSTFSTTGLKDEG